MKDKLVYIAPLDTAYFITKINNETHLKCYHKAVVPVMILLGCEIEGNIVDNAVGDISLIIDNVNSDILNEIKEIAFNRYEYFELRVRLALYDKNFFIDYLTNDLIYWMISYYHTVVVAYNKNNRIDRFNFDNMLGHYELAKYIVENTTLDNVKHKLNDFCTRIKTDETIKNIANLIGVEL